MNRNLYMYTVLCAVTAVQQVVHGGWGRATFLLVVWSGILLFHHISGWRQHPPSARSTTRLQGNTPHALGFAALERGQIEPVWTAGLLAHKVRLLRPLGVVIGCLTIQILSPSPGVRILAGILAVFSAFQASFWGCVFHIEGFRSPDESEFDAMELYGKFHFLGFCGEWESSARRDGDLFVSAWIPRPPDNPGSSTPYSYSALRDFAYELLSNHIAGAMEGFRTTALRAWNWNKDAAEESDVHGKAETARNATDETDPIPD